MAELAPETILQLRKFLTQTVLSAAKSYHGKPLPSYIRVTVPVDGTSTQIGIYKKHLLPILRQWADDFIPSSQREALEDDGQFLEYLSTHKELLDTLVEDVQPKSIPKVFNNLLHTGDTTETPPPSTQEQDQAAAEVIKEDKEHKETKKVYKPSATVQKPKPAATTPAGNNQPDQSAQPDTSETPTVEAPRLFSDYKMQPLPDEDDTNRTQPVQTVPREEVETAPPPQAEPRPFSEYRMPELPDEPPPPPQPRFSRPRISLPRFRVPVPVERAIRSGSFKAASGVTSLASNIGGQLLRGSFGALSKAGMFVPTPVGAAARVARLASGGSSLTGEAASLAKKAALNNPTVRIFLLLFLLIFIGLPLLMMLMKENAYLGGALGPTEAAMPGAQPSTPPIPDTSLLKVGKTVDKTTAKVGDLITYSINVSAAVLAGNKVSVIEKLPEGTSFISASDNGTLQDNSVSWLLEAVKNSASSTKVIPPRGQPAPAGFGRPVQRITATPAQIKAELERNGSPYAQYYQTVYDVGKKYNVDPAFIMAVWRMENAYGVRGGYANNPGSIVYVSDGYLGGMTKGRFNVGRYWATWPTFEQGLEAIPMLIANEYYPKGQTDVWTIHSGVNGLGEHAYHGQGDIGQGDIKTWEDYVGFYYKWISVMDNVTGGSDYSISQGITLTVRVDQDNTYIKNTARAFAPNIGDVLSSPTSVRIGNAPAEDDPKQIPAPPGTSEIIARIKSEFGVDVVQAQRGTSVAFEERHLRWMWEALATARARAPKFPSLIHSRSSTVQIIYTGGGSETFNGRTPVQVQLGPNTLADTEGTLFKQIFIHELGHVIHGNGGGSYSNGVDELNTVVAKERYLTAYGQICGGGVDEDFAETISYYIFKDIREQPISRCAPINNQNPMVTRPLHYEFAKTLLGGN